LLVFFTNGGKKVQATIVSSLHVGSLPNGTVLATTSNGMQTAKLCATQAIVYNGYKTIFCSDF